MDISGNVLIDGLMKQLFEMEFDRGGQTASTGDTVDKRTLEWLMDDWFISKEPPKSTGREVRTNRTIKINLFSILLLAV